MIRMKLRLPEPAPQCVEHDGRSVPLSIHSVAVKEKGWELGQPVRYTRYLITGVACCDDAMILAAREQVIDFLGREEADEMIYTSIL